MIKQKILISVIGGHCCEEKVGHLAWNVGQIIAKLGCILVNGGLNGTMEEASRGCKEAGGMTIGLLPGKDKAEANPYVDIPILTTIGFARNAMVACTGDIIVALPGSYGTSSEISYAMIYQKPVIDLGGWNVEGMIKVDSLEELEDVLKKLIINIKMVRDIE